MRLFIFLFALKIFYSSNSFSQPIIQWQVSFGGNKLDEVNSIKQTFDGGYIVVGQTFSNDGDVVGNNSDSLFSDYWILKLNATGAMQWQRTLGGLLGENAKSVKQTLDGGYIIAGYA